MSAIVQRYLPLYPPTTQEAISCGAADCEACRLHRLAPRLAAPHPLQQAREGGAPVRMLHSNLLPR